MVYAEQQRERYVSVFDVAARAAVRLARLLRSAARRSQRARALALASQPTKDARKRTPAATRTLTAQAPPRASAARMRDDVEALRVQRLL